MTSAEHANLVFLLDMLEDVERAGHIVKIAPLLNEAVRAEASNDYSGYLETLKKSHEIGELQSAVNVMREAIL